MSRRPEDNQGWQGVVRVREKVEGRIPASDRGMEMNQVLLTSKEVAALLQGLRQTEADVGVEPEPAQELPRPGAPRAMSPRRPGLGFHHISRRRAVIKQLIRQLQWPHKTRGLEQG
jgi:hypothetical protein